MKPMYKCHNCGALFDKPLFVPDPFSYLGQLGQYLCPECCEDDIEEAWDDDDDDPDE